MGVIVITLILSFIVTCFEFIAEGIFRNPDVKNKVKHFFQLLGAWTIIFGAFGAFACKLTGL